MKTILTVIFSALWVVSLSAQNENETKLEDYEAKENLRELGSTSGTGAVQTFDNRYKGVKGSQFAFSEWYEGEVFMKEKTRVKFPNLNYNCFQNVIVYKEDESGTIYQVNKRLVDFFILKGPVEYKFVPVQLDKTEEPIFAALLSDGSTKVYKVFLKEFLKANYEGGYSADREYDEFVDKVHYYISFGADSDPIRLKPAKSMSKLFPDHNSEMKKFIGNYSAKELKTDTVLKQIAAYYDSL